MKRYRVAEIICIVILLVFIGVLSADETASDKTVKEVAGAVISDVSIKGLTKQSEMQIKKELSLTAKEYDGIYFAKSDDVMDVREILIIKLKENQSAEDAIKKIEKRVSAKQTLFEGYAPEQSAMLKNYVLRQKAGFIFYCVLKESGTAVSVFNKTL